MEDGKDDKARIKDLEAQVELLTKQRNAMAFYGGREAGRRDAELRSVRADAALVVHALNCAIQLIDALIAYLPEGSPISGGVATCKNNLDMAMLQLSRQRPTASPTPIPAPPDYSPTDPKPDPQKEN